MWLFPIYTRLRRIPNCNRAESYSRLVCFQNGISYFEVLTYAFHSIFILEAGQACLTNI